VSFDLLAVLRLRLQPAAAAASVAGSLLLPVGSWLQAAHSGCCGCRGCHLFFAVFLSR
jgi:hypothetical protein